MLYEITYPGENKIEKKLSEMPFIHPSAVIINCRLGSWTEIGAGSKLTETVFDDFSYDAGSTQIIYSEIGKFCSIASHVRINPGNHPKERVMQHHCTYRKKLFGFSEADDMLFFNWRRANKCVIGNDVWIGHSAIIMPGVRIGNGAVIGSQSVVTKNIMPFEIAVGVPAKPIKKRFTDDIIEKIEKIGWWNWDYETVKKRLDDFNDIRLFIEKYS